MPASKRRQSAKVDRPPQCTYREGGRRCVRNGYGRPSLCRPHLIVVTEEAGRAPADPNRPGARVGDVVNRFVRNQPISSEDLMDALADLAGLFAGVRPQQGQQQPFTPFSPFSPFTPFTPFTPGGRSQDPPPMTDEQLAKREAIRRARVIFGFGHGEAVTPDELKSRRRDLSKKHHPDRGGSLGKMQEINNAHDILAAELG